MTVVSNRWRWTFGVVAPKSCSAHLAEPWRRSALCHFVAPSSAVLYVCLRFLHVTRRSIAQLRGGALHRVDTLELEGERHLASEEGLLTEQAFELALREPCAQELVIAAAARHDIEWLRSADGVLVGNIVRESQALLGSVRARTELVEPSRSLWSLSFSVENRSLSAPKPERRDAALVSLINTHVSVRLSSGEFSSEGERLDAVLADCDTLSGTEAMPRASVLRGRAACSSS